MLYSTLYKMLLCRQILQRKKQEHDEEHDEGQKNSILQHRFLVTTAEQSLRLKT